MSYVDKLRSYGRSATSEPQFHNYTGYNFFRDLTSHVIPGTVSFTFLWGSMLPLSVLGSLHHSINYIMKRQLTEVIFFFPSFFPLLFLASKEITKCGVQEINRGEFSWT